MDYTIRFGSRALKDLRKLDNQISGRILGRIEGLANDLSGDVKRLTDHTPQYRLRVGDFRVLFDVDEDTVQIQRVLNRREAY
jgi:mRNA interferase RelE/StbE